MNKINILVAGHEHSRLVINLLANKKIVREHNYSEYIFDHHNFVLDKLDIMVTNIEYSMVKLNELVIKQSLSYNLAMVVMRKGRLHVEYRDCVEYIRSVLGTIPILLIVTDCEGDIPLYKWGTENEEYCSTAIDISKMLCVAVCKDNNSLIIEQKKESKLLLETFIKDNCNQSYIFDNNKIFSMVSSYLKHIKTGKYLRSSTKLFDFGAFELSNKPDKFKFASTRGYTSCVKHLDTVIIKDNTDMAKYAHKSFGSTISFSCNDNKSDWNIDMSDQWQILFVPMNLDAEYFNRLYSLFSLECLWRNGELTQDVCDVITSKLFNFRIHQKVKFRNVKHKNEYIYASKDKVKCAIDKEDVWAIIHC